MTRLRRFSFAIAQFKKLGAHPDRVTQRASKNGDLESSFVSAVHELNSLKQVVLNARRAETEQLIARKRVALRLSTFELMEHDFKENTHSNVLQYLFDYGSGFRDGASILSSFIGGINGLKGREYLLKLIQKQQYYIEREKAIPSGRLDLFIVDTKNRFVVVVENKLLAGIGKRRPMNRNASNRTQLDAYIAFVHSHYRGYRRAFVLLSYAPTPDDVFPFCKADYSQLLRVFEEVQSEDVVLNEYRLLLRSLVNGSFPKRDIFEEIHRLVATPKEEIDLSTLERINGALT